MKVLKTEAINEMCSKKFNRSDDGGNGGRFVPTAVKPGDRVYIVAVPDRTDRGALLLEGTVGVITRHPESETSAAVMRGGEIDLSVGGPACELRRNRLPISGLYGAGADRARYGMGLSAGSYVYRRAEDAVSAYIKESATREMEQRTEQEQRTERDQRTEQEERTEQEQRTERDDVRAGEILRAARAALLLRLLLLRHGMQNL